MFPHTGPLRPLGLIAGHSMAKPYSWCKSYSSDRSRVLMVIHRHSLSLANAGTGPLDRRLHSTKGGNAIHHGATHLLIKLPGLSVLPTPGKREGIPIENGHGTEARPHGSRRQHVIRTLEIGRNHRTSGLRYNHTNPGFGGL